MTIRFLKRSISEGQKLYFVCTKSHVMCFEIIIKACLLQKITSIQNKKLESLVK